MKIVASSKVLNYAVRGNVSYVYGFMTHDHLSELLAAMDDGDFIDKKIKRKTRKIL